MKQLLASLLLTYGVASAQQTAGTTALDPTQVYVTGNLVQPTVAGTNQTPWVNGVYQDQLSCWAWGNPGNCGPNPTVRPGNLINYSFGYTDLYQIQAISSVLPTTGLRVNGYNFGFMAKNGNGWDDGRLDQLNAYVTFYGTDGKVKDYTNYDLNSQFNWTQFNYTKDFVTPYADKDLSTVRYGFTGKDNNFWAGTYGPEIYNVSFSLKYSVDPCATNVLSSPTCPGYSDALAKLLPTTSPVSTPATETMDPPPNSMSEPLPPPGSPPPPGLPPPGSKPDQTPTSVGTTITAVSSTTNKDSKDNSNGTNIGLSVIAKNQQREQSIAMQASQDAVSTAEQTAQQAQQDAVATAQSSSNASVVGSGGSANRTVTTANVVSSSVQQSTAVVNQTLTIELLQLPQPLTQQTAQQNTSTVFNLTGQVATQTLSTRHQHNAPAPEVAGFDSQKMLLDRTSPLFQTLDYKPIEIQNTTSFSTGPVVNKNAQNNDLAGGVDLNRIAQTPGGYNEYLNLALKDVAFYAPKEVYKNQRNVDNARALRALSSDRLHQDMVDQQYRK